ncbi:hypothetical protein QOZ80_1BG0095380 [Eleusine coracana subsp. coracana]|nr:hypothetical protein QOZ80_1BG0095380 [Eleusine coracana subsp. coracana]
MAQPGSWSPERPDSPAWIILDTKARTGRRDDGTTARTVTSTGSTIAVSLMAVDPPGVSHCVVHCPELITAGANLMMRNPPIVSGAGGRFLLLSVRFPHRDVFIYKIGATPSLHLVPRPYPRNLGFDHVGVLPCHNNDDAITSCGEHCLVVVLENLLNSGELHVFSTETQSWTTKVARVHGGRDWVWYQQTKVLDVGGGVLAWVDLRHGVLLCNVLAEDPVIRLIKLPPLMPINNDIYGLRSDGIIPPLQGIRDATCCANGMIRLIELEYPGLNNDNGIGETGTIDHCLRRWRVTIFERMVYADRWEKRRAVDSTDLFPAADSCLPDEIWNYEESRLKCDVCMDPMLSAYQEDVVYMTCKLDARDTRGWVLPVDTGARKLEKAMPFSDQRLYFNHNYMQLDFNKYLLG